MSAQEERDIGAPHSQFHLLLVARIALGVALVAAAALYGVIAYIDTGTGDGYAGAVRAFAMSRESVGPAMLVAGVILLCAACVLTWLVSLYASFRIAGPLFRFTRNIELAAAGGDARPIPIRQSDLLQGASRQLIETIEDLRARRGRIASLSRDGSRHAAGPEADGAALGRIIDALREETGGVRIDQT